MLPAPAAALCARHDNQPLAVLGAGLHDPAGAAVAQGKPRVGMCIGMHASPSWVGIGMCLPSVHLRPPPPPPRPSALMWSARGQMDTYAPGAPTSTSTLCFVVAACYLPVRQGAWGCCICHLAHQLIGRGVWLPLTACMHAKGRHGRNPQTRQACLSSVQSINIGSSWPSAAASACSCACPARSACWIGGPTVC